MVIVAAKPSRTDRVQGHSRATAYVIIAVQRTRARRIAPAYSRYQKTIMAAADRWVDRVTCQEKTAFGAKTARYSHLSKHHPAPCTHLRNAPAAKGQSIAKKQHRWPISLTLTPKCRPRSRSYLEML